MYFALKSNDMRIEMILNSDLLYFFFKNPKKNGKRRIFHKFPKESLVHWSDIFNANWDACGRDSSRNRSASKLI